MDWKVGGLPIHIFRFIADIVLAGKETEQWQYEEGEQPPQVGYRKDV